MSHSISHLVLYIAAAHTIALAVARSSINIQPYAEKYEGKLGDLRKAMQTGITVLHTAVLVMRVLDIVNSHGPFLIALSILEG